MKKKVVIIFVCILVITTFPLIKNVTTLSINNKNIDQMLKKSIFLNNPPYIPSNPNPINNSINVNIITNLTWTGGDPDPDDNVSYNIFFGTNPDPPIAIIVHFEESYNPGRLNYNTQYYWKVDAYDGTTAVEGPIWTFHTKDNTPPNTPSNPNPSDESFNINITTNLNWIGGDPDNDPVKYDIYLGTNTNPPKIQNNHTSTTYTPTQLEYNTQYYWRINTWDDYGYSTIGPIWTFHTKDNTPPNTPSNPNPSDESFNINITTNLNWIGGDPDNDPVKYDIYLGTNTNPPKIQNNHTSTTYTPTQLEYNTQYYWRINTWDDYGYSTIGPIWTFHTKDNTPPNTPSNPNPSDESFNINITTNLNWIGGDPDNDPVKYDIYLGTNTNPPKIQNNHTSTTYTPTQLEYNTQYYWRINAWDDYGYSTTGPIWKFTTRFPNSPPNKPRSPSGPINGHTFISYSYTSSSIDIDGDKIFYMFDWDDGTSIHWIGAFESGQNVTVSHTWTTKGSYNIKVKAKDEYGAESTWSDPLQIRMPKNQRIEKIEIESFLRNEMKFIIK